MKSQWIVAAFLSSALLVGCGDRNQTNAQNPENAAAPIAGTGAADQGNPPAANVPAQASSPAYTAGGDAARPPSASPTSNRRQPSAAPSVPPASASRPGGALAPAPPVSAEAGRPAAASPAPPAPEWRELTIPAGTTVPLELTTAISSETARVETPVQARVRQAIVINGYTAIPAGSIVTGEVTDVERSGRVQGRARLALRFNEVRVNGEREDLRTEPVTFEAEATKGEDATKVGAGAGIGAIIGGIAGGGKGAAKGGAIGGAVGTGVVLATRGKEVTLASGTDLAPALAQPTTVRVRR